MFRTRSQPWVWGLGDQWSTLLIPKGERTIGERGAVASVPTGAASAPRRRGCCRSRVSWFLVRERRVPKRNCGSGAVARADRCPWTAVAVAGFQRGWRRWGADKSDWAGTDSHPRNGGGGGCIRREGPQRRPQRRLDRRLKEVAKAVGGGYCRLQMPLKLALGGREIVAGRRLGTLEGGGGVATPSFKPRPAHTPTHHSRTYQASHCPFIPPPAPGPCRGAHRPPRAAPESCWSASARTAAACPPPAAGPPPAPGSPGSACAA